ncbi:hypothetical protein NMY22_g7518 [Coprinellus aureogranulatus]|nr:hypothetical protein NMY22_g7518 [Coprinellus aureogranulatus]
MAILVPHEALVGREIPKLNGSSGAFIAVVVVLVLIIIVACTAVAYLILESRQDGRHSHRQYQPSPRGLEARNATTSKPTSRSFLDRLMSKHKRKTSTLVEDQKPRRSGQGWVQATQDDGDDDEIASAKRRAGHAAQMSEVLDTSRPPSALPSVNASPTSTQRPLPSGNRPRVSSMLSDTSMSIASYREGTNLRYQEPFAPVPQRSMSTFTTQLAPSMFSSPSSTPPPSITRAMSGSPEQLSGDESLQPAGLVYPNGRGRPFTTHSGTSMLTFEGGTKFMEEL